MSDKILNSNKINIDDAIDISSQDNFIEIDAIEENLSFVSEDGIDVSDDSFLSVDNSDGLVDSSFVELEGTDNAVELDESPVFATNEDEILYYNYHKAKDEKFLKSAQGNAKGKYKKPSKYTKVQKVKIAKMGVNNAKDFMESQDINEHAFNKGKEAVVNKIKMNASNKARNVAMAFIKGIAKAVGKMIMSIISLLGPIGAVILGLVLVVVIVTSLFCVNEHNRQVTTTLTGNELAIYSYFKSKDFTDIQIASILGNWYQESHNDPQAIQNPSKSILASGGIGLAQWTVRSRKEDGILLYVKSKSRMGTYEGWDNINYQLEFAYAEMFPGYSGDAKPFAKLQWSYYDSWSKMTDLEEAVKLFCEKFEGAGNPKMEVRIEKAKEYLTQMGGYAGNLDYVKFAVNIASDDTHGYCQSHRSGNPDYDCSSLVYYSLLKTANIPANIGEFTTSDMGQALESCGFTKEKFTGIEALVEGDILWMKGHTEIYIGDGRTVGAHLDSSGTTKCKAGKGDQNGNEISIANCSLSWKYYYRKNNKK